MVLAILLAGLASSGCAPGPASSAVEVPPSQESTPAPSQSVETTEPVAPEAPTAEPTEVTVIGTSVQGREILAHRAGIGDKRLLVVGGIHGNEHGAEVAEAFLAELRRSTSLVPEGAEIHVIPSINPDGVAASKRGNANDVDLNLNMPASTWERDLHPNTRAYQSGLYGGEAPGSERETQAFIGYMERDFDLVISLHSSGGVVDWDGDAEELARQMAGIAGLQAKHLPVQPYATGTMGQYVPEVWGIPVITIELESASMDAGIRDALLFAAESL